MASVFLLASLDKNQLCGLDIIGLGTYTAEGITKICDMLKTNGSLRELKCVPFNSRL